MHLTCFTVRNFRRLKEVRVELDEKTTIFVGANNSGKTAATEVFEKFLGESKPSFSLHDFCVQCWKAFEDLGDKALAGEPTTAQFPNLSLDLWLHVTASDVHRVLDLLPSLDWTEAPVGVRIAFVPVDPARLLENFKEAHKGAREELASSDLKDAYDPWPATMVDYLRRRLSTEYDIRYFVLDHSQFGEDFNEKAGYIPAPLGTSDNSGRAILAKIIRIDLLKASRHGAEGSSSDKSESLSKRMRGFYERNLEQRKDDFHALAALARSETQLNEHLASVFESTLSTLNTLGYPGFTDPKMVIRSTIDGRSITGGNTRVHYDLGGDGGSSAGCLLPDEYNGLGFKNLIYMVIELLDFSAKWISTDGVRPPLHLVMIEEPEAHLHAQLQQVFISHVYDVLAKDGASGSAYKSQLIVTTHSPHIIYESGFKPIRYFRRSRDTGRSQSSVVLNLSKFYSNSDLPIRDFLERYMKLTHCDLFFADAAILVEGNVERLLIPAMISKAAPELKSRYLSILEVGGAFAYRFKELVEFLGIVTLVITDLDSVSDGHDPSDAAGESTTDDGDDDGESHRGGKCCRTTEPDAVTSNRTLQTWLPGLKRIAELLAATADRRTQAATSASPAVVYVAYQSSQEIAWKEEKASLSGRTLEEAFALENLQWCQNASQKHVQLHVAKSATLTLDQLAERIFRRVKGESFNKTEFALVLMAEEASNWNVPAYISDGLKWLANELSPANPIAAATETEAAV